MRDRPVAIPHHTPIFPTADPTLSICATALPACSAVTTISASASNYSVRLFLAVCASLACDGCAVFAQHSAEVHCRHVAVQRECGFCVVVVLFAVCVVYWHLWEQPCREWGCGEGVCESCGASQGASCAQHFFIRMIHSICGFGVGSTGSSVSAVCEECSALFSSHHACKAECVCLTAHSRVLHRILHITHTLTPQHRRIRIHPFALTRAEGKRTAVIRLREHSSGCVVINVKVTLTRTQCEDLHACRRG